MSIFTIRLAYLSIIFEKLNGLNTSLQGENSTQSLSEKVQAFVHKLEHCRESIKTGRIDMFTELEEFIEEHSL